jgi:hypothetical protein
MTQIPPAKLSLYSGKYPRNAADFGDLARIVEDFVLPGFVPDKPVISSADRIRAQGSCFAENIVHALTSRGMNARLMGLNELINSPKANEIFFRHVLKPDLALAHPDHHTVFPNFAQANIAAKISDTSLLIFTFGVAPYAVDKATGIPTFNTDQTKPNNYVIHQPTVDEIKSSMTAIFSMVRQINPTIKIIATISPVPLNRSALPSAVVADCISKSTLRASLAEVLAQPSIDVWYWPSFEIIRWLGAHLGPVFGADDGLARHVNKAMIGLVIDLFLKHYAGLAPTERSQGLS